MNIKKQTLTAGFLGAVFVFLFSVNFVFAQSCGDPYGAGNCEFSPCPSGTHQIADSYPSPICGGEWVCCAANPSGGLPTSGTNATPFDECIAQGGDYNDCKDRQGAPASTSTSTGKGVGQNCNLTSECASGLTCYVASGASQATCQAVSYSGGSAPAGSSGSAGATASGGWSLGNISTFGLPGGSVRGIIENILIWMLGLFGIIGILGFLISGIIYLTAAGDEERMAYAKRAMQYSIIGVIVGLVGFVVIQAIDYALNAYSRF